MEYTLYKPDGEIYLCISGENYVPSENNWIEGGYSMFQYYVDVENKVAVPFPPKPSEYSVFDFQTKQWVDSYPLAEQNVKIQRNELLMQSDWTQLPNNPLTPEKQQQWADYRQQLRDIPAQPGYPFNVVWPTKPT
jgi:hypothetical protein